MTSPPDPSPAPRRWNRHGVSGLPLLLGLLFVAAAPFLLFHYVPVEDGPAHVANGAILSNHGSAAFSEYFDIDFSQGTNLLADLLMGGLLAFLSAALADKAMALFLVAGIPLAARWCLRLLDPDAAWMAILVIPLSGGFLLYFGFYNFLLGVALSLFAFGFWLKHIRSGRAGARAWAGLAGLFFLVFLSHPLPFLALLLMLAAAVLDEWLNVGQRGTASLRMLAPGVLPIVTASVIPLLLLVGFGAERSTAIGYSRAFLVRILAFPLDPVQALTYAEIPFVLVYMVVVGLLGLVALLRWRNGVPRAPGFPIAVLLLFLLYFFGPDSVGKGSFILPRTELYLVVLLLFAAARQSIPRSVRTTSVVLGSVAIAGLAIVRLPVHSQIDAEIREYLSGTPVLRPGSTVLPLWGVEHERGFGAGGQRMQPLRERAGYLTAMRGAVDLRHFPGYEDIFPINFAPGYGIKEYAPVADRYRDLFDLGPYVLDLAEYDRSGNGRIDYVWLWNRAATDSAVLAEPRSVQVLRQLQEHFDLVHVSSGGRLEVFARKEE